MGEAEGDERLFEAFGAGGGEQGQAARPLGGRAGEAELLATCYRACFALAIAHDLHSLAFPAISCGVYGYPPEAAARIAVREARTALACAGGPTAVRLVAFDPSMARLLHQALDAPA